MLQDISNITVIVISIDIHVFRLLIIKSIITGYSDSNFAACILTRLSMSSLLFALVLDQLNGALKDKSDSTAVAEMVTANKPISVLQWIDTVLRILV